MKSLDEKKWKPVSIGEQFKLCRGRESKMTVEEGGKLPFVSAKKTDNGYRMFIKASNTEIDGNTLSLNNNGNGGAGFGYYQPYKYTVDVNTTALIPRSNIPFDSCIGLFWVGCFSWMHEYFGNARTLSNKRAEMTKIMLPINDKGTPDYDYMAKYMCQKRKIMLKRYCEYAEACVEKLGDAVDIPTLEEKEWSHFKMPEIFEVIKRGKRLKNSDHVLGDIPYVSSTANNNGVDNYIEKIPGTRMFGNCISLANSGSVGTAFYEPFNFVASDHVTALKKEGMSKYVYLFLVSTIEKQGYNFNFNREINDTRIKNMQIMLPIDDNAKPDYVYMEQYIKNTMLRKYKQYLTFLETNNILSSEDE